MRITLPAEVCKKAHKFCKLPLKGVTKTLEVLGYVKVSVDADGYAFYANNLEMNVSYYPGLSYTGETVGEMLIPLELLDVIGDGYVTFADDGNELIRDYLGTVQAHKIDPNDYPVGSAKVDKLVAWFSANQMKDLTSLIPFCSKDESRPNLFAVRLLGKDGFIRFDATDGYKLAMIESAPAFEFKDEQLVPLPVLQKLKGLLTTVKPNKVGWAVQTIVKDAIHRAEPYGSFYMEYAGGEIELGYTAIQGKFPNTDDIRDSVHPTGTEYAEIETDKLRLYVDAAVKSKQEHVPLMFHDGKMSFGDAEQPFPLTFKEIPLNFTAHFNPVYLQACLSLFNGHCQFHSVARNLPATFKADGREVILMPMNIPDYTGIVVS